MKENAAATAARDTRSTAKKMDSSQAGWSKQKRSEQS
jgi:hypothetical protein